MTTTHYASTTIPDFVMTSLKKPPLLFDDKWTLTAYDIANSEPIPNGAPAKAWGTHWGTYKLEWDAKEWTNDKLSTKFRIITDSLSQKSSWSQTYSLGLTKWYEMFYREVIDGESDPDSDDKWRSVDDISDSKYDKFTFNYSGSKSVWIAVSVSLSPDQKMDTNYSSLKYDGDPSKPPNDSTIIITGPIQIAVS